jgi:hypothetical protein
VVDDTLGRGRSLAGPAFPADDGSADPVLRELLGGGCGSEEQMLQALASSRLLVAVMAVADEIADDGSDKSSHMAVVSMVNAAGEKGLLAFTGLDSMAAWNPEARPVPVPARAAAEAALADGAQALVIDVAGPARVVIPAEALPELLGSPEA